MHRSRSKPPACQAITAPRRPTGRVQGRFKARERRQRPDAPRYTRSNTRSGLVRRLFERIETTMIARSRVVITICRELQDTAVALGAGDRASLIENVMGGDVEGGGSFPPAELRARYGLRHDQPVVLYTGTFEPYQELDLLFDAAGRARSKTRGSGR